MKLMILDGNSIVNRAFYGIRMLNAPDGTPTNAVYGFLTIFQRILELEQPQAVCVAFDVHAPTFRHEQYALYKAQRKPMPEELVVQMPLLKQTLDHMGIRRLELAGWEADDLLGTVAKRCEAAGWACEIVTGDKDSLQLITDTTHVCHVKTRMGQTETIEYTPEVFRAEYGFDPIHMIDLKALMGDSSDNIPGVLGIGEKTAKDLLVRFGTVADIYRDLDTLDIKPGVRKKLTEGRESAQLSFDLATIRTDAPIDFAPESAVWDRDYRPELYDWFRRLGFLKLSEKWGLQPADGAAAPENALPPLPTVDVTDSTALHALEQAVDDSRCAAASARDFTHAVLLCLNPQNTGGVVHDLHQFFRRVHLQAEDDAETVAQRRGKRARARGRADQREFGQVEPDAPRRRPLADHNIQRVILHRGVEHLFDRVGQAVDFVDKQHVAAGKVGQQAGQIARALDGRAAGHADVLPHLAGDDARERRLAQTRRAVEQNVVERIPSLPGGLNIDVQAVLHRLLPDVFAQGFGAEAALLIVLFLAEAAHHKSFFFHLLTSCRFKRSDFPSRYRNSRSRRAWLQGRRAAHPDRRRARRATHIDRAASC